MDDNPPDLSLLFTLGAISGVSCNLTLIRPDTLVMTLVIFGLVRVETCRVGTGRERADAEGKMNKQVEPFR